jgi:penicillin-binding protein 1C
MGVIESNAGGAGRVSVATPRIRYPAADTIIALDPDIPTASQRVVFEASPAIGGLGWRLDGATLPNTDAYGRADWTPAPGKHTLALVGVDGRTLAMVAFEVRGNSAR